MCILPSKKHKSNKMAKVKQKPVVKKGKRLHKKRPLVIDSSDSEIDVQQPKKCLFKKSDTNKPGKSLDEEQLDEDDEIEYVDIPDCEDQPAKLAAADIVKMAAANIVKAAAAAANTSKASTAITAPAEVSRITKPTKTAKSKAKTAPKSNFGQERLGDMPTVTVFKPGTLINQKKATPSAKPTRKVTLKLGPKTCGAAKETTATNNDLPEVTVNF